jgi:hypothetical protein
MSTSWSGPTRSSARTGVDRRATTTAIRNLDTITADGRWCTAYIRTRGAGIDGDPTDTLGAGVRSSFERSYQGCLAVPRSAGELTG